MGVGGAYVSHARISVTVPSRSFHGVFQVRIGNKKRPFCSLEMYPIKEQCFIENFQYKASANISP